MKAYVWPAQSDPALYLPSRWIFKTAGDGQEQLVQALVRVTCPNWADRRVAG